MPNRFKLAEIGSECVACGCCVRVCPGAQSRSFGVYALKPTRKNVLAAGNVQEHARLL